MRPRIPSLVVTGALGLAALAIAAPPASAAAGCTTTTPAIGETVTCNVAGTETITVPSGANAVDIVAIGGGGRGGDAFRGVGGAGGAGAKVEASLRLTSTASLSVTVGDHAVAVTSTPAGYSAVQSAAGPLVIAGGGGSGGFANGSGAVGGRGGSGAAAGTAAGGDGENQGASTTNGGRGGANGVGGETGSGGIAIGNGASWASGGAGGASLGGTAGMGGSGYGGGGGGGLYDSATDADPGGGAGGSYADVSALRGTAVFMASPGPEGAGGAGGIGTPSVGAFGSPGSAGLVTLTFRITPGAPTDVSATAGVRSASVTWNAGSDGGLPITEYVVTSSPGGQTCRTATTSCTVGRLTAGVGYSFTVEAINEHGAGPASAASNTVTPTTGESGGGSSGGSATPVTPIPVAAPIETAPVAAAPAVTEPVAQPVVQPVVVPQQRALIAGYRPPARIRPVGTTVLVPRPLTTTDGTPVRASARLQAVKRSQRSGARIIRDGGRIWVSSDGRAPFTVRLVLTAPATATSLALREVHTWRVPAAS